MLRKVSVVVIALIISCASIPVSALETNAINDTVYETDIISDNTAIYPQVIDRATEWLKTNYGQFYELRDINANVIKQIDTMNKSRYTVSITCEKMYKYDNVEEIPFVRGMLSELNKKTLTQAQMNNVNAKIQQIEEDAAFGEYTELSVDVVVEVNTADLTVPWKLYYQDGVDTVLYDIALLELDEEELYGAGIQAIDEISKEPISVISTESTRGYASYDRLSARNYSRLYSSNPTTCDKCGKGKCDCLQDTSKWNTDEYPYFPGFLHNDCADFVSQAMSEGGIPEKSGWYRTKGGNNGTWTNSWIQVSKLKEYMTRSDHVYWDESTFAACNAGNILLTSSGHVVMVDYNDGTTHRFNGHTNDRRCYAFGNVSSYQYYVIKRTN